MDRIGTRSINGGRTEASEALKKVLEGTEEMPFALSARIYLQISQLIRHPLFEHFGEAVRIPLTDAVALLWRIKEIEQAGLGDAASDLFRASVDQVGLPVKKQIQTVHRLAESHGVDLHQNHSGQMRGVALDLIEKLQSELQSWGGNLPQIAGNDQMIAEFLDGKLPLYWELLLNLCLVVRQLLDRLDTLLQSMVFSLQMIGAPVRVNQRMVRNLTMNLWHAVKVLEIMKKFLQAGNGVSELSRLEKILDGALIYPPYHQLLAAAVDRVNTLLEEQDDVSANSSFSFDLMPNFQELKKNYLERAYREAAYCWGKDQTGVPVAGRETAGNGDGDPSIAVESHYLDELLPLRLLSMLRQTMDQGLVNEAEMLFRTYTLAANMTDVNALAKQEQYFESWRKLEKQIEDYRQDFRRRTFRVVK